MLLCHLKSNRIRYKIILERDRDYYLYLILARKVEIQQTLYMLGSKLGLILPGRTQGSAEKTEAVEQNMLAIKCGSEIQGEISLFTSLDKSLPVKPDLDGVGH